MAFKNEGMLWDKECIYWIFVALLMKCELSRIALAHFFRGDNIASCCVEGHYTHGFLILFNRFIA
ncbi:hypothetical protein CEQ28_021490 [Hafnia alvei]|nr:hypothetical protein CEQ28_021490 [Hafnia alvei]